MHRSTAWPRLLPWSTAGSLHTAVLRKALAAAGVTLHARVEDGLPGAGHILLIEATGEETYDVVRDTVAGLGLGLVRMEQRRHHIAEVFRPEAAAQPMEVQAR